MDSRRDLPGFHSPAAGPGQPLALLGACHRRVERQCDTLGRLPSHLADYGSDAVAQEASRAVLRYFDTAAVHHHADEEQDLFPALLAHALPRERDAVGTLTESLVREHRLLEQQWQVLRDPLQRIADAQVLVLDSRQVDAFRQAYRSHIGREDAILLPLAERILPTEALKTLGQSMARRRGLT
ncbi:MAG: hemerythrin domain-containing protein [Rhodoferax sp.]|nr:hemerythrin domain-containing protein [Rhodoferax sp.]